MALCPVDRRLPLLVTPIASGKDAEKMGSFAAVVDCTLAHVRQVLIEEHSRRLQVDGSLAKKIDKSSWEFLPGSQPSTFAQPPFRADAESQTSTLAPPPLTADDVQKPATCCDPVTYIECGTQTQGDWSWPELVPPWTKIGELCNNTSLGLQSDASALSDDHACNDPATGDECHISRLTRVTAMTSGDLRGYFQHKPQRTSCGEDSAWKRILVRSQRSPIVFLDGLMGFVIIANAISLGASCDTKDWEQGWLILDSIFAACFVAELLFKICFLGLSGYFCGDDAYWAWFETALVIMSVVEVVVMSVTDSSVLNGSSAFRIIRLLRLVKILRICRVPAAADVVMMVTGFIGGARTLLSAFCLVLFPLFIFALVMRETLGEESDGRYGSTSFNTLPKACFHTFRCLVTEDCSDESGRPIFVLVSDAYGWGYGFIYCAALILLKFGLYNVIVAIFVEQTVRAAKHNMLYQKRARLNDKLMFQEKSLEMAELAYSLKTNIPLAQVSMTWDDLEKMEISRDEFGELCTNSTFTTLLGELDVAEEDHLGLFDTLDVDGGRTLDVSEIFSGIEKLRGDARRSDIVTVMLLAKHLNNNLFDFENKTTKVLERQNRHLKSIQKDLHSIIGARVGWMRDGNAVAGA